MPREDMERSFAGLKGDRYKITSPATPAYNCAAWAASETERCWDPAAQGGDYWPAEVPHVLSLANVTAAFATLGFAPCDTAELEPGFEKLALYADGRGEPTHVARQLPSGAWTSKLGAAEDIEHDSLADLEGPVYGQVARVLRRPRRAV